MGSSEKALDKYFKTVRLNKELKNKARFDEMENITDSYVAGVADYDEILRFFDKTNSNWKDEYNKIEENKPKVIQAKIDTKKVTINDIIKAPEGIREAELALTVSVSNRIAHGLEYTIKEKIRDYLNNTGMVYRGKDENGKDKSNVQVEKIYAAMRKYFNEANYGNPKIMKNCESILQRNGIELSDIYDKTESKNDMYGFDRDTMESAFATIREAFYLKDYSLMNLLQHLDEQVKNGEDYINYGRAQDEAGKEVFIMDVPCFGQFAVHLKEINQQASEKAEAVGKEYSASEKSKVDEHIKAALAVNELLKDREYEGKLYEEETVMLTDTIDKDTTDFYSKLSEMTVKDADMAIAEEAKRTKDDPERIKHYLTVKYEGEDPRGDR